MNYKNLMRCVCLSYAVFVVCSEDEFAIYSPHRHGCTPPTTIPQMTQSTVPVHNTTDDYLSPEDQQKFPNFLSDVLCILSSPDTHRHPQQKAGSPYFDVGDESDIEFMNTPLVLSDSEDEKTEQSAPKKLADLQQKFNRAVDRAKKKSSK